MRRMAGLWAALLLVLALTPVQAGAVELPIQAEAALLMEKETGQVLYAQNEHEALEPASVTKVMTLLLTMEAIEKGSLHYDDVVTVSAYAASMGGSHVYLSEGEQITVDDLLKAVCVASGNDAAVALAECVTGVTELFVEQMNTRAKELGMTDTHFVNCTGLPAEGHVTSAWDIALMSRELIEKHPDIRRYTTIWMDTLRDGTFQLANTNKLIRFYDGATGLKTGSTDSAKYCLSATAEREGMELIAVVLKSPHRPAAVRGRQGPAELRLLHLCPAAHGAGGTFPRHPGGAGGDGDGAALHRPAGSGGAAAEKSGRGSVPVRHTGGTGGGPGVHRTGTGDSDADGCRRRDGAVHPHPGGAERGAPYLRYHAAPDAVGGIFCRLKAAFG